MISSKAIIEDGVELGVNVQVWEGSKIRAGAKVGDNTIIGMGVYIGPGVVIGQNCKIQNLSQIYDPAVIGNGVFIGPGVILTNDKYPAAVSEDGTLKSSLDWTPSLVKVEDFARIGAGAICVAPVTIGQGSMIAAGAVVTKDVAPGTTVMGVPAR